MNHFDHDVAIIGSGPSGIAAATALSRAGVRKITVFEREAEIGGIPRHTHHPSFGLLIFKCPMSGPKFITALLKRCPEVEFQTNNSVTAFRSDGEFDIATVTGITTHRARHIILATGARETTRHARLTSGLRPANVMTTGALQQFIYNAKIRPFERPVIVGTELVSFSALWTLRNAGIKAVAMIEENSNITAYAPVSLFARGLGVPIYRNTTISDIGGITNLQRITIEETTVGQREINCDGLIFSGKFVGENTLVRASHLALSPETQLPLVDQNWLSSDLAISVIGNATHPADMGDQCYQEGLEAGKYVAALLAGKSKPAASYLTIHHDDTIKMTTPNIVRPANDRFDISLHVTRPHTGQIEISVNGELIYSKLKRSLPARRINLKKIPLAPTTINSETTIRVSLKQKN
ncbi:MAG: NAD(P)/FAD-dependent oxidoreductase [Paracoccaceae bacterium]